MASRILVEQIDCIILSSVLSRLLCITYLFQESEMDNGLVREPRSPTQAQVMSELLC